MSPYKKAAEMAKNAGFTIEQAATKSKSLRQMLSKIVFRSPEANRELAGRAGKEMSGITCPINKADPLNVIDIVLKRKMKSMIAIK